MKTSRILRAGGAATERALRPVLRSFRRAVGSSALLGVVGLTLVPPRRPLLLFSAICFLSSACLATAQTIYVPGGTATGIGSISGSNVGIGTSTPGSKLTVVGNIKSSTGDVQVDAAHGIIDVSAAASVMFDGNGKITAATQNSQPFVFTGGNVGIGTTSPGGMLQVTGGNSVTPTLMINAPVYPMIDFFSDNGNASNRNWRIASVYNAYGTFQILNSTAQGGAPTTPRFNIDLNGNVGIGVTTPGGKLQVTGGDSSTPTLMINAPVYPMIDFFSDNGNANNRNWRIASVYNAYGTFQILSSTTQGGAPSTPRFNIDLNGNVGIGTTSPSHKLAVNGTIRAKEVIVDTGWSDYIFAEDYRLAPLAEVEAHIKAEKHLPGIPSAAEVARGGVSLGDMQAKLLAKVEELTLHAIEQQKALKAQQAEIATLRAELARLSTHN